MKLNSRFNEVFNNKPILGMIHLAGFDPVKRAIKELKIFEQEGIDGAIIENYHGLLEAVIHTLKVVSKLKINIIIGVNVLPNEFQLSLPMAAEYNADFIQLDYVAGRYVEGELDFKAYSNLKKQFQDIIVLGGVHPKYFTPVAGSNLEEDLKQGVQRAEAIVVTGEATGKETPLEKIKYFRKMLGKHPLIVGAGLTPENAYEQLIMADGAIVGTSLKENDDTHNEVDKYRVRDFMSVVKKAREHKE
ncbi:hypothetical protein AYK26_04760 [Euryarchaeota archaeon SM23-78]|nr:MAG: hypothetical protein AYK26_04760 [Euryarchaeota archaeon SM23-78]MBW3000751.1 membrane biogenesis protein [Candidatus Woesearchaeota archaeon]